MLKNFLIVTILNVFTIISIFEKEKCNLQDQ